MPTNDVSKIRFLIQSIVQDVKFGARVLLRNPGFTLVAVMTLALGVGANTAVFSVIYGVLLRPLPYRNGNQLVVLHQRATLADVKDMQFSAKDFFDYRDQNKTLESAVEHHSMSFILYGHDEPQRVQTGVVSWNFFDVLGIKPILGRTFDANDERPGADAVLILSNKYWRESHGADPNIVGRIFQMNNRPHLVIGVLPAFPQYPAESDVYMPTTQCPFRSSQAFIDNRSARMMTVFGRLKDGMSVSLAQADISNIGGNLAAEYPSDYLKSEGYKPEVVSLRDDLTQAARPTFLILMATAGLVLLIACANVANLSLARILRRKREVALRTALGASRKRLIRQLLTESTILSLLGGAMGIIVAEIGLPSLVSLSARFTDRTEEIAIDSSVLIFTLLVSVATGVFFGLMPALSFGGDSIDTLASTLKEDGGRGVSSGRNRIRSTLVVLQVAVSFTLLVAAAMMISSLIRLQHVSTGFNSDNVLVMRISPSFSKYTTQTDISTLYKRILENVKPQVGVQSAAVASSFPLNPAGITQGPGTVSVLIDGQPVGEGQLAPRLDPNSASPDYFQTIGAVLTRGRTFDDHDDEKAPQVAIVNEAAVRHRWSGVDPIGKRVSFDAGKTWVQIVGVIGNVKQYGLDKDDSDEIYVPVAQAGFAGNLLVKTSGDPMQFSKAIRDAVHQIDPQIAIDRINTLEQFKKDSIASPRLTALLLSVFAAVALVITAAGIAGVMALSVAQRTREIGIRMALGASRGGVLAMVMRQGMVLVAIGLVAGIAGALLLGAFMKSLLSASSSADPIVFAGVTILLACVACLACFVPSRRATVIDPAISLRSE